MKDAVSIINAIKNPLNLGVFITFIVGAAILTGADVDMPKWSLFVFLFVIFCTVVVTDVIKTKRANEMSNSDEKISALNLEVDSLRKEIDLLKKEIEEKKHILETYDELEDEVRSYFSVSDDYLVDDVVEKFIKLSGNERRENQFRTTIGQLERKGILYNYVGRGTLRLKK
ncbi:hypothetical protein [Vibrio parahaemolyticus]|uniref:hypothetical protein n=1 Tax=Vibrio parahaemolyticus TaxID=670 RepID=UPI0028F3E5C5|nr:hypothetical protein [Vibrio parahaemolyticus]WMP11078.1 hypothetical protein NI383_14570 [Vibrio parahaemolyticus]